MKYATVSGAVRWSGGTTIIHEGMSADQDHPLVLERPDLFGDEAPPPMLASSGGDARRSVLTTEGRTRVERATRAPGEVRGTDRRA